MKSYVLLTMHHSTCTHLTVYQQKLFLLNADDVTRNDVKQNVNPGAATECACSNVHREHCALSCLQYNAIRSQRHKVTLLSGTQSCILNPISDTESEVPALRDCSPHLRQARFWMASAALFWICLCFALVSTDEEGWSGVTPFICYLLNRLESRRHGELWEVAEAQTLLT